MSIELPNARNIFIPPVPDKIDKAYLETLKQYIESVNTKAFDNAKVIADGINSGLSIPHLMQSDSTDQAIANVANAQVITFDTDVHHHDIARTTSSRFTISQKGSYLIAFSGICVGANGKLLEVWLRVNDADIANSNTIYAFKTTGTMGIVAVAFIEHFNVGDYFEFWTWGDAVTSTWKATAAGTSPTRPACPSIIITANYIGSD